MLHSREVRCCGESGRQCRSTAVRVVQLLNQGSGTKAVVGPCTACAGGWGGWWLYRIWWYPVQRFGGAAHRGPVVAMCCGVARRGRVAARHSQGLVGRATVASPDSRFKVCWMMLNMVWSSPGGAGAEGSRLLCASAWRDDAAFQFLVFWTALQLSRQV